MDGVSVGESSRKGTMAGHSGEIGTGTNGAGWKGRLSLADVSRTERWDNAEPSQRGRGQTSLSLEASIVEMLSQPASSL